MHRDGDSRMHGGIPENTLLPKGAESRQDLWRSRDRLCVPKDSGGRAPELLRNTELGHSSPAQRVLLTQGAQETGPGLPAFSESASEA